MTDFLVYALVGKLIIYITQIFPFPFREGRFLYKLWKCDLCLGVWIYAFLAYAFGINLLQDWFYIPVINEIIMGMATSFLVQLISLGWNEKFTVLSVEWTDADNE